MISTAVSKPLPELGTSRLTLRQFQLEDAAHVQRLASDRSVADTTLRVPHPYLDGMAEEWINSHGPAFTAGAGVTLAITESKSGALVGAIGLDVRRQHDSAELGYWVGTEFWNRGYCTEAALALLDYAFECLRLHRVYASHLKRNPASGRVLLKLGMQREGELRQHVKKWARYEDLILYGVLREEWTPRGV